MQAIPTNMTIDKNSDARISPNHIRNFATLLVKLPNMAHGKCHTIGGAWITYAAPSKL